MAQSRAWHVFISYARLPDSAVALQLRRYLMSITRPWWGFSNLRVFLDKDTMVPTSELRVQIAEILSASSSMVLLACPESAQSPWVSEEVDQWMDERGKRPLIVVHTGGVLEFLPPSQDGRGGVAWKTTTALNPARFKDDPARKRELDENSEQEHTYWISDLLPVSERLSAEAGAARPDAAPTDTAAPSNTAASTDAAASTTPSGASLTRRRQAAAAVWASARLHRRERAALRRTAYDVLAGVLDLDRDRLSSFETRRRRSSFAAITSVVVALAALLTATVIAQVRVQYDTKQAFSRQLAADAVHNAASDPDVAALVAVQAYHIAPTEEAKDAVVAAASGPLQRVLRGHTAPVTSVAAGGDIAVTGSEDGTARVWDAHTGAPVNVLTPGCGVIQQVAVSPDAQLLLIVCPTTVRSFDLPTGTLRGSLNVNGSIDKLAYSAEHDIAVVEGGQGNAWMWQPSTGRLLHTLSGHAGTVTAAAVTADGRTAATGDMAGGVRLWDVSTGELEAVLRPGNNINVDAPSPTFVGDLAFTGDGRTLTVADNDGTASLWNVTSRSRSHLLTGASGGILSVATSPDNTTVATASLDGSVRTWDTATGALRQTMSVGGVGSGFIRSVRFSHDGRSLLTVSQNQLAVLWDAHDGTRIATLSGHTAPVQAGEFCPDDSCVVTGSGDGTARLWNTGAVLGHLVSDVTIQVSAPAILRCVGA